MDYDPVKDRLITYFERSVLLQRVFFRVLHTVFLRSWYVRRALGRLLPGRSGGASAAAFGEKDGPFRVLDAGTGFGQYTDWMLRRSAKVHVTAVDIKRDYLERLASYLDATGHALRSSVRYGDLVKLKEKGPFDLIVCVDVMEHILEDREVFANFARVLSGGGHVIINTPSDQGGSAVTGDDDASFIGEHVRDGYGREEITEKLAGAGLEVVSFEYGYGAAGSMGWRILVQGPIRLLANSMLWAPLVALYYVLALPVGILLNAADLAVANATGTGVTVVARKMP